jgi:hypothetical protein
VPTGSCRSSPFTLFPRTPHPIALPPLRGLFGIGEFGVAPVIPVLLNEVAGTGERLLVPEQPRDGAGRRPCAAASARAPRSARLHAGPPGCRRSLVPRALDINHAGRYYGFVIKTFKCADTETLARGRRVRRFVSIESVAQVAATGNRGPVRRLARAASQPAGRPQGRSRRAVQHPCERSVPRLFPLDDGRRGGR